MVVTKEIGKHDTCAMHGSYLQYFKCMHLSICGRFDDMDLFFRLFWPDHRCRQPVAALACSFTLGLILGACFSVSASETLTPTMRAAATGCVSIPGLLSAMLLPFLFSAFAVYISNQWLLFPIAFCKAFLFAFLSVGLMGAFGSAGWLIRLLLMFGDILSMPLLWWFWIRSLTTRRGPALRCLVPVIALLLAVGSFDYCVISPFAAGLIS